MKSEVIALVSATILAIIGLFRDEQFISFLKGIFVPVRHPSDVIRIEELEAENRELIKQRDIAQALEAMLEEVGDDASSKKAKALQRVLSKGSKRH